jgi:hypothetical protein
VVNAGESSAGKKNSAMSGRKTRVLAPSPMPLSLAAGIAFLHVRHVFLASALRKRYPMIFEE